MATRNPWRSIGSAPASGQFIGWEEGAEVHSPLMRCPEMSAHLGYPVYACEEGSFHSLQAWRPKVGVPDPMPATIARSVREREVAFSKSEMFK